MVAKKAEVKVTESKESKKQVKEEEAEEEEEDDEDEEDDDEEDDEDEEDEEEESDDESEEESESEDEDLTPIERARARIMVIKFCDIINLIENCSLSFIIFSIRLVVFYCEFFTVSSLLLELLGQIQLIFDQIFLW